MRTVRGRGQGQDTGAAQLAHGAAELAASPPSVPPPPPPATSSSPAALAHMLMEPGSLEEPPSTLGDKHSGLASWSPPGVKLACLLSQEDNRGFWPCERDQSCI